jgi:hypothetical protein
MYGLQLNVILGVDDWNSVIHYARSVERFIKLPKTTWDLDSLNVVAGNGGRYRHRPL